MRGWVGALMGCIVVVGCAGHAAPPAAAPQPAPATPAEVADTREPTDAIPPFSDDSAADEAALQALDQLQFTAGGRNGRFRAGGPARVSSDDIKGESARIFTGSHGGAASAAGPTYDIDVESYANHARVQYYMDFFLGEARGRFTIWLGRLQRYEGMIRDRLRAEGVPEDLVYLALIESGYSNTAISQARAVGMWQFVARTGRRYGLREDAWVDERRDPFKATDAAARHLAELDQRFGSWYLAAAAYNAGAGRVSRSIRRLSDAGDSLSDDTFFELYDSRYLRRETKDYVPKLIAAALIAKDPARYGFDSIPALAPLEFDEVRITAQTGLDVIARLADTTTRSVVELNPQFIRGVTPPGRTAIVRVPRGTGAEVARRWAALPASERVSFLEHRIARGETLSEIAHRFRMGVALLRAANPSVKPRLLRVGTRLTIPISRAARHDVAEGRRPARIVPPPFRPAYHTVRRGESLWTISRRYGVKVSDLRKWNGIAVAQVLRVGEHLRVRPPAGGEAALR